MIQSNIMVKGIKIGQEEIKISQFADDNYYGPLRELLASLWISIGSENEDV